jgi:hypothetical protein
VCAVCCVGSLCVLCVLCALQGGRTAVRHHALCVRRHVLHGTDKARARVCVWMAPPRQGLYTVQILTVTVPYYTEIHCTICTISLYSLHEACVVRICGARMA